MSQEGDDRMLKGLALELMALRCQLSEIEKRLEQYRRVEPSPPAVPPAVPARPVSRDLPPVQAQPQPLGEAGEIISVSDEAAKAVKPSGEPTGAGVHVGPPSVLPTLDTEKAEDSPRQLELDPRARFEQMVGTRGLLYVGVVVLLLAATFFLKYAIDMGWVSVEVRLLAGAIAGLVLLSVGELARASGLKVYASAISGAGIVLLYLVVFIASPNGMYEDHQIFGPNESTGLAIAFCLMSAVTAIGAIVSLRIGIQATAIISLLGALATPVMLSSGQDRQVVLFSYLLLVDVGFLASAAYKRWNAIAPIAFVGSVVLFAGWFAEFYSLRTLPWYWTNCFAWPFLAAFTAYSYFRRPGKTVADQVEALLPVAVGGGLVILLLCQDLGATAMFSQLLVLNIGLLTLAHLIKTGAARVAAHAWTILAVYLYVLDHTSVHQGLADSGLAWSIWIWALYCPLLADALIRTFRADARTSQRLDGLLVSAGGAWMFLMTYCLLNFDYSRWMGAYAAALGLMMIGLAVVTSRRAHRPSVPTAFLCQGLVLIAMAAPIQFNFSAVTIAWVVQGVVAMALARTLDNKVLAIKSAVVLGLAVIHLYGFTLTDGDVVALEMFSVGGVEFKVSLGLSLVVSAGLCISAVIALARNPRADRGIYRTLGMAMACVAVVLYCFRTAEELPALGATWWWLALAGVLVGLGWGQKRQLVIVLGVVVAAMACGKWLGYDTLGLRMRRDADITRMLVLNWQMGAGIALAALLVVTVKFMERRRARFGPEASDFSRGVPVLGVIVAAVLVVWAGSFEIDRHFQAQLGANYRAMHMTYSIWWALCACGALAIGFAVSRQELRFTALAIFAVTLSKVFIVDMQDVKTVYRILSFFALGVTLLGGAFLYHRVYLSAGKQEQ